MAKELTWTHIGDVWMSHFRQFILRMRHTPSGWIVSYERGGGTWAPIVGAPTRPEVERKANEWAVSQ